MPKRIVDGEALWTSTKLGNVTPKEFRFHYANWLPMAEANGVFEANLAIIRSKVYGFLSPETTNNKVSRIFNEFLRVGLLSVYEADGKTWAYFNGIHKPGRLPSGAHVTRYKNLPPDPPPELSGTDPGLSGTDPGVCRITPEGFGFGVGSGIGIGIGLEEEEMNHNTRISDQFKKAFGKKISRADPFLKDIAALGREYGPDAVFQAFRDWTESGVDTGDQNLQAFVRQADAQLKTEQVNSNIDMKPLLSELTFISNNRVLFGNRQATSIAKWLPEYSISEILLAFREFYEPISGDDRELKYAATKFSETGVYLMEAARKRKRLMDKQNELIKQQELEMQREAEERKIARDKKLAEEAELIEDELTV